MIIRNTQQDQRASWSPAHHEPEWPLHGREVSRERGYEYNHLLPHGPAKDVIQQEQIKSTHQMLHLKILSNQRVYKTHKDMYLNKVVHATHNL